MALSPNIEDNSIIPPMASTRDVSAGGSETFRSIFLKRTVPLDHDLVLQPSGSGLSGRLGQLPGELMFTGFEPLDLATLLMLRSVHSSLRSTINEFTPYAAIIKYAPTALRAVIAHRIAQYIGVLQLHRVLLLEK